MLFFLFYYFPLEQFSKEIFLELPLRLSRPLLHFLSLQLIVSVAREAGHKFLSRFSLPLESCNSGRLGHQSRRKRRPEGGGMPHSQLAQEEGKMEMAILIGPRKSPRPPSNVPTLSRRKLSVQCSVCRLISVLRVLRGRELRKQRQGRRRRQVQA